MYTGIGLGLGLGLGTRGAPSIYPPGILARWEAGLGVTAEPTDPKYVSAWADQVSTYDVTQAVQASQLLYVPAVPELAVAGNTDYLLNGDLGTALGNGVTAFWCAIVFKSNVAAQNGGLFTLGTHTGNYGMFTVVQTSGQVRVLTHSTYPPPRTLGVFTDTTSYHVVVARVVGLDVHHSVDGGAEVSGVIPSALDFAGLSAVIMSYYQPGFSKDGSVREVALGTDSLSESGALGLSTALMAKYGI